VTEAMAKPAEPTSKKTGTAHNQSQERTDNMGCSPGGSSSSDQQICDAIDGGSIGWIDQENAFVVDLDADTLIQMGQDQMFFRRLARAFGKQPNP
jgi:hypothetical protein